MDFGLSEEQIALKRTVRDFCEGEIIPKIQTYYDEAKFPRDILQKMGKLGFFGCALPEMYGGIEMGFLSEVLVAEEVARADPGVSSNFNVQGVTVPTAIYHYGTEEQALEYIPKFLSVELVPFWAMTEPDAGSDFAAITCRAVKRNGYYTLNGSKMWITHAPVADIGVVFAKTAPELKHKGVSGFIVDTSWPGVTTTTIKGKFLNPICPVGEVILQDVEVPEENLLGVENEGFAAALNSMDFGRVVVPARSVGWAQACLEFAVKYANERMAFSQRIGSFQMIQKSIADMVVELEAARWLVYRAAWLKDIGQPSSLESSIAKLFATEAAERVCSTAMTIHGGNAFSDEFPVSKFYARVRISMNGEGSSNIQRVIIAQDALGWKKANRHLLRGRRAELEKSTA
jgi:alkylation response protein AidB-like acyl-CoA dehydrogenase